MDTYEIITWQKAMTLKNEINGQFLMRIEKNLATVYKLDDLSYIVLPLSPLGKGIIVKDRNLLDKWISERYFPTNEPVNAFYFSNKNKMDNICEHSTLLKSELFQYIYKNSSEQPEINPDAIDSIHKTLIKRKRFKDFKLHFIVLVGDFLIEKYSSEQCRWGLFESRQLLNPYTTLVLVKPYKDSFSCFELQERITGKWGYMGIRNVEFYFKRPWFQSNETDLIVKVF